MSRKRNDPVRNAYTGGYISRFVFRRLHALHDVVYGSGAPEPPKLGVSAQKIEFSGFDLMHKQMILC